MQPKQLFTYDQWANHKIADVLDVQPPSKIEKSAGLFAHIRAAQQIWLRRIAGKSTVDIALWPSNTSVVNNFEQLNKIHLQWIALLNEKKDTLAKKISYKNSKGKSFTTPLLGILHHVIIHGQHHRAQIATLLSQNNINPPGTDFIFYLREKKNQ